MLAIAALFNLAALRLRQDNALQLIQIISSFEMIVANFLSAYLFGGFRGLAYTSVPLSPVAAFFIGGVPMGLFMTSSSLLQIIFWYWIDTPATGGIEANRTILMLLLSYTGGTGLVGLCYEVIQSESSRVMMEFMQRMEDLNKRLASESVNRTAQQIRREQARTVSPNSSPRTTPEGPRILSPINSPQSPSLGKLDVNNIPDFIGVYYGTKQKRPQSAVVPLEANKEQFTNESPQSEPNSPLFTSFDPRSKVSNPSLIKKRSQPHSMRYTSTTVELQDLSRNTGRRMSVDEGVSFAPKF